MPMCLGMQSGCGSGSRLGLLGVSHTFKVPGGKQDKQGEKHFAPSIAECVSRNGSGRVTRSLFLPEPASMVLSASPQGRWRFQNGTFLVSRRQFCFHQNVTVLSDRGLGTPLGRAATTGIERARSTALLLQKQAMV